MYVLLATFRFVQIYRGLQTMAGLHGLHLVLSVEYFWPDLFNFIILFSVKILAFIRIFFMKKTAAVFCING